MNPIIRLKVMVHRSRVSRAKSRVLAAPDYAIEAEDFAASLRSPTMYYGRAFQDFHRVLPPELREHRSYFEQEGRGFGEAAFHTLWWRLMRRFRPQSFLEIGVYRGQTISLVSLIAKLEGLTCQVTGISPFSAAGDSVSTYGAGLDYYQDTLANFRHFGLPDPELCRAFSTDDQAMALIAGRKWDMIYIDGNHDYDVVKADWACCSEAVMPGGLIVLDDSGLTTDFRPPAFATAGHPGPSKLASEIDCNAFEEILQVGHNRVFRKR